MTGRYTPIIDISDSTNLLVVSPIVLTDDTLSFDLGVTDTLYVRRDGTSDMTGNWTISTASITLTAGTLQAHDVIVGEVAGTQGYLNLFGGSGGSKFGGNVAWYNSFTGGQSQILGGHTYINQDLKLVFDTVDQTSTTSDGMAYINFSDGSAKFADGSYLIDASGNVAVPSGTNIGTTLDPTLLGLKNGNFEVTGLFEVLFDASNTADFSVDAGGNLTITASGGLIDFGNENLDISGTVNIGSGTITQEQLLVQKSTSSASQIGINSMLTLTGSPGSGINHALKFSALDSRTGGSFTNAINGVFGLTQYNSTIRNLAVRGGFFQSQYFKQSSGGLVDDLIGVESLVEGQATADAGTITRMSAYKASMSVAKQVPTNAYMYNAPSATTGTGAPVTMHAFFDAGQTIGSSANWGIAINTADNYINGSLRIGSAVDPVNALDVTGAMTAGDGGITNYLAVWPTGNLGFNGSAEVETDMPFKTLVFPVIDKASGNGIKVDTTAPTFGFADLLGDQFSRNTGATKPTLTAYNGAVQAWQFGAGDEAYLSYHIPHDYVIGTDIFLHIHWSQNAAGATGGTLDFKYFAIYAKGHNQVSGSAFTTTPITATFTSVDISGGSGTTQYQHHLTEVIISAATATAALFDRDDFEPDGVIELTLEMDADNLTGTASTPFIHYVDIHYQTNSIIGTKDKVPDFYT